MTRMGYDTLYQEWLEAKQRKDFIEADKLRDEFEFLHGLTIFAEGDMPVENVTVRPIRQSTWYRKFSDRLPRKIWMDEDYWIKVGGSIDREDSKIKKMYPIYAGLPARGSVYEFSEANV